MIEFRSVNIPLDEYNTLLKYKEAYSNKFIIYHDNKQVLIKTQPEMIDCISKANSYLQKVILERNKEIDKLLIEKEQLEKELNNIPRWIRNCFSFF